MAATRTTQSDMLRTVYQPRMRVQFNLKSILLQKFRRNTENWAEGKEISIPIHAGRTGGYGFSDTGDLPTADNQQVERANFNYSRLYGRIQIDAAHMKGASKSYAAEARPYDLETKSLVRQLRDSVNFHLFGDGSAQLTTCADVDATDVAGITTLTVISTKGLHKNQFVDLLKISDKLPDDGFRYGKILSIVQATKVVKITVLAWDETAFNADGTLFALYQSLTLTKSSVDGAFSGLELAISDTGTYGGIDRSVAGNEFWKGQALTPSGSGVDPWLALIQEATDLVDINSDGEVDLMVTTHEIWTHLMNHLVDKKRYTVREYLLNGWAKALDFNGIPIIRDKHCTAGKLYGLDTSTFTIYQNDEGSWMDEDGAVLHRVTDKEAYEATWSRYMELVCDQPAANFILDNLIDVYPTSAAGGSAGDAS